MLRARASTDLRSAVCPHRDPDRSDAATPGDEGSAALEFILVGLVLLVPLVYLIVALGSIQGQSLGVETGARQLARAEHARKRVLIDNLAARRVYDIGGWLHQLEATRIQKMKGRWCMRRID